MDRRLSRMLKDVARAGPSGYEFGAFAYGQFSQLYRKGLITMERGTGGQHVAKITPKGKQALAGTESRTMDRETFEAIIKRTVHEALAGRSTEAKDPKDRAKYALKDMAKVREGTLDAERFVGYVSTELQAIGSESGNQTAASHAKKLRQIQSQLGQMNKKLEQAAVFLNQLAR